MLLFSNTPDTRLGSSQTTVSVHVNERKAEIDNNFILYTYFKNRKNTYDINRKKHVYPFMKNQDIFLFENKNICT